MNIAPIVSKVWSLCTTLCDDGRYHRYEAHGIGRREVKRKRYLD